MENFIRKMPKIELHAHLNGSLTEKTLLKLCALKYGESSELYKEICSKIKITSEVTLQQCFQYFPIAHDLTSTKECLYKATLCAIEDYAEDNVIYLELRTTPKETHTMTKMEYLECVLQAISQARNIYPKILVKLLPSIDRSRGVQSAKDTIECIRALKEKYLQIIVGIDFSGNPEKGTFLEYKDLLQEARDMGLKLALHCGEIRNDKEVFEMLTFGMDRCGHGTFINGENDNFELLKQKNIPLECCLTSNIKCETVPSYFDHHFKELFEMNHPVVICTDDFAVFDTSLSNELRIACATYKLSRNDLEVLMKNAVEFSFANELEKDYLRDLVDGYFNKEKFA